MLEELLSDYKKITLDTIEKANRGEDIANNMESREDIISKIINSDLNPSKVKEAYEREGLNELDEKLNTSIKMQMENLKTELNNSRNRKKAYSSYSRANMTTNIYSTRV